MVSILDDAASSRGTFNDLAARSVVFRKKLPGVNYLIGKKSVKKPVGLKNSRFNL